VKFSPLDIQQQRFNVKFRGYDIEEVETFLDSVAQELEDHVQKINELNDELERKNERIWEYQNMEKTLKETLMIAQSASEEVRKNARKAADDQRQAARREAEAVIADAKQQAGRIMEETNTQLAKVLAELSELKGKKIVVRQELRSLLETHLQLLDQDSEERSRLEDDDDVPAFNE